MILSSIIGAIGLASDLFSTGKEVYEAVSGTPSTANTPEELEIEAGNLPPDQLKSFESQMTQKINMYKAITERVRVQGGEINSETLSAIPEKRRGEIAYMRMTTRPWVVRQLTRVIMLPFYIICVDAIVQTHNLIQAAFSSAEKPTQIGLLAHTLMADGAPYVDLYQWAAPTAASVIATYMGLREYGKKKGHGDDITVKSVAGTVTDLFNKAKNLL